MLICVLVLRVAPSWAARWLGCRRRGRCCCAPSGTRRPSWTPSDSRLSSTRAPWSRRGRGATWSWETCTLSYSIRSALFELLHVEAVVHFFMVSYWYVCVCWIRPVVKASWPRSCRRSSSVCCSVPWWRQRASYWTLWPNWTTPYTSAASAHLVKPLNSLKHRFIS